MRVAKIKGLICVIIGLTIISATAIMTINSKVERNENQSTKKLEIVTTMPEKSVVTTKKVEETTNQVKETEIVTEKQTEATTKQPTTTKKLEETIDKVNVELDSVHKVSEGVMEVASFFPKAWVKIVATVLPAATAMIFRKKK